MWRKHMLTAVEVMTTNVISVMPGTPVRDIVKLLCTRHISGVPVIDREKRVIGIVSESDLIGRAEVVGEQRRSRWLAALTNSSALAHDYVKTHGRIAADVMTAPVITAPPTASLAECAKTLERHRIKRVPVVEDGRLIGIVTRGNLLQALATADAAEPASLDDRTIRGRLLAELETQRWAHLSNKNIVVKDGVVELWGVVETEEERHAWRVAAENVPGVKRIEDHARLRSLFRLG